MSNAKAAQAPVSAAYPVCIADLFKSSGAGKDEVARAIKADDFNDIAKKTAEGKKPIPWSAMQQKISAVIAAALNSPVMDAWVSAWQSYDLIVEKAEESAQSPRATVECAVEEHSVESQIAPQIDVYFNRVHIGAVACAVGFTTHFESILLEFKAGELVAIAPGRCSWSGSIAANGVTLIERDLAEWPYPGRMELEKPIRLARPSH